MKNWCVGIASSHIVITIKNADSEKCEKPCDFVDKARSGQLRSLNLSTSIEYKNVTPISIKYTI
jgi:hypothetical protein